MESNVATPAVGLAGQDQGRPRGLVPPTQRGRSRRMLGEVIVELGFAARGDVEEAVRAARAGGRPTGQVLIDSGLISQAQLARALGERLGLDFVDLSIFEIDMGAVNLLLPENVRRYSAVPVGFMPDGALLVAMADPTNVMTIDEISMITGLEIRPGVAAEADILALINRLSDLDAAVQDIAEAEEEIQPDLELRESSEAAPAIKLVHTIIARAIEQNASDIHWNPGSPEMQVMFRIDGVPKHGATVPRKMVNSVVSRIKIMADLDISERRLSQDGRVALNVDGRRVDIRIVTLPLINGEGIVMRILDTGNVVRNLDSLGMDQVSRSRFVKAIGRPYGAILVTGPTGCGKSTTLYGALDVINDGKRSIVTIEDPVETQIDGVKQMQVAAKNGVTFATGLRSILRADPDVIMVGEIRDKDTAQIAIQAALTGHLVLSTLHTRDAPTAITRLIDMGIEPFLVAGAIDCVVAQRLARTLCVHCKRSFDIPQPVRHDNDLGDAEVFEPVGCIRCGWTGYRGRTALYEVMPMSEEMREMLIERHRIDEISTVAKRNGMRTMAEDGMAKVKEGLTSLVEVTRVTSTL
jgi:type IV pilus assembly protein PilB